MIGWLWREIVGFFCVHRWKTVAEGKRVDSRELSVGTWHTKECGECGVMQTWKL